MALADKCSWGVREPSVLGMRCRVGIELERLWLCNPTLNPRFCRLVNHLIYLLKPLVTSVIWIGHILFWYEPGDYSRAAAKLLDVIEILTVHDQDEIVRDQILFGQRSGALMCDVVSVHGHDFDAPWVSGIALVPTGGACGVHEQIQAFKLGMVLEQAFADWGTADVAEANH